MSGTALGENKMVTPKREECYVFPRYMIKERVLLCSDAYLVWVAFELSHLTWRPRRMTWDREDGQEKRKGNKQRGLSRYQEAKEKVGSESQETFQNSNYHPCETGEWNPGNGLGWEEIASWERNTVAYSGKSRYPAVF